MIVHSSKNPIIIKEAELKIGKVNGYNDIWNKVMQECAEYICKKLNQNKKIKSIEVSDYKGCSIDIKFDEIKDKSEWAKFCKQNIVPVLDDAIKVFSEKYDSKFFWDDKVGSDDGLLIVLDSSVGEVYCSCCGRKQCPGDSFSKYKNRFLLCDKCKDVLFAIEEGKKEKYKDIDLVFKTKFENRMKKYGEKDFKDWYDKEF